MAQTGPDSIPNPWVFGPNLSLGYAAGGLTIGTPTGGQLGPGTINIANGYYINGVALPGALGSQSANLIYASPNGSSGTPVFRSLTVGDLPTNFAIAGTLGVTGLTSLGALSVSGTVSGTGITSLFAAPPPLGATPNTGAFTALSATLSSTIAGIPFNTAVTPPGSFSPSAGPGILLTNGTPFYIAGAPTSAAQDIPSGTLYVSKDTNYTGIPASGTPPAIYGFNNVHAGAQGPQEGVLGYVFNANTLTSQPAGTSGAIGVEGVGICSVASATATWGMVAAAYDTSAQNNPPHGLIGLEVDNYANGTDASGNRVGILIVAGTPTGSGTVNTVSHGLLFNGSGAAGNGQFVNLIDGGTAHTVNGVALAAMTGSGVAYNSPGFQVDWLGNEIANAFTATGLITGRASTSGGASMNIPQGAAPTTPNNGDIWMTVAGLFYRFNGTTHGPL
jgi:hypothetical protein